MTPTEFGRLARKVVGRKHGWQTRIADELKVAPRTVRDWLNGTTLVPGPIDVALRCLAGKARSEASQ